MKINVRSSKDRFEREGAFGELCILRVLEPANMEFWSIHSSQFIRAVVGGSDLSP